MQFRKRSHVVWIFPVLILLTGCDAGPACDSIETRKAVLQFVADDHNNALGNFAAKTSSAPRTESNDASPRPEDPGKADGAKQRPLYRLGEQMVTRSTSRDKRTLTCSGAISATVGDTKASKEVNFTVQQSPDGKLSVSVAPFEFEVPSTGAPPKAD